MAETELQLEQQRTIGWISKKNVSSPSSYSLQPDPQNSKIKMTKLKVL